MNYHHIRNATAIIEFSGVRLLIDPFLSSKGSLPSVPSQDNELQNPIVDLPCSIDDIIQNVDAVIVTHMHHFDHFDDVAKAVLRKNLPIFTQNIREQNDMRQLGFEEVYVLSEAGTVYKNMTLYKTAAEHGGSSAQAYYDKFKIPSDACGVVLTHPDENNLYLVGDTLWNESVENNIKKFKPKNIILNAAQAEFLGGIPILMGTEGVLKVSRTAPNANLILVHLEAVNHTKITRKEMRDFTEMHHLRDNIYIPDDGEILQSL